MSVYKFNDFISHRSTPVSHTCTWNVTSLYPILALCLSMQNHPQISSQPNAIEVQTHMRWRPWVTILNYIKAVRQWYYVNEHEHLMPGENHFIWAAYPKCCGHAHFQNGLFLFLSLFLYFIHLICRFVWMHMHSNRWCTHSGRSARLLSSLHFFFCCNIISYEHSGFIVMSIEHK